MSMPENAPSAPQRADWMRLLALSPTADLETAMHALGELPRYQWLRKPETGMTMVQGRSGGTGARFNLGEMTITRCALILSAPAHEELVGMAYVKGRSARHAECAAIADAMLQSPTWHEHVMRVVLGPLQAARQDRLAQRAEALAQTRVDFFTLDRGENPDD